MIYNSSSRTKGHRLYAELFGIHASTREESLEEKSVVARVIKPKNRPAIGSRPIRGAGDTVYQKLVAASRLTVANGLPA